MISNSILKGLLLGVCSGFLCNTNAADSAMSGTDTLGQNSAVDYIVLGMGCFWGAEKRMSAIPGVVDVESGYANGEIEPSYRAILNHEKARRMGKSNRENYAEVVKVTFDPARIDLKSVLIAFWENHDPTQGDRQGNDIGSNYRSAIYSHSEKQLSIAQSTRTVYQNALHQQGYGDITTDIAQLTSYHAAEEYHQDYLKKHPNGYCGLGGTGVKYPGSLHSSRTDQEAAPQLDGKALDYSRQLVVFEAEECAYCKQFKADILDHWQSDVAVTRTLNPHPPSNWSLKKALFATPTIVLFEQGREVARYTGYNGEQKRFWSWLDSRMLKL